MTSDLGKAIDNDEVVRGLRERSPEVIDRLVDEHSDCLFRYLLRLTRDHHTAEDISQETWMRVLQRGYQYQGTHGFRTWLFSIAKRLVIDLSRQRKSLTSLDAMMDDEPRFQLESVVMDSPIDLLHHQELHRYLHTRIKRLPREQQEVLVLRVDYELALTEIACVTKVSVSRVKQRLYRALGALRIRQFPDRYRQRLDQAPAAA